MLPSKLVIEHILVIYSLLSQDMICSESLAQSCRVKGQLRFIFFFFKKQCSPLQHHLGRPHVNYYDLVLSKSFLNSPANFKRAKLHCCTPHCVLDFSSNAHINSRERSFLHSDTKCRNSRHDCDISRFEAGDNTILT